MMWGDHDGWSGGWLPMLLGMVAFWGVAVFAVLWIVRRPTARPTASDEPEDDAEGILRRRFARGEIDDREYHVRLDALRGGPPGAPTV
jgi:putative membrane protein